MNTLIKYSPEQQNMLFNQWLILKGSLFLQNAFIQKAI